MHYTDKVWKIPHPRGPAHSSSTSSTRVCWSPRTAAGSSPGSWAAAGRVGAYAGVGFEVLLDVRVPQYAREVDEEPWSNLLKKVAAVDRRRARKKAQEKEEHEKKKMWKLNDKVTSGILISAEEMAAWRRWGGLGPSSSTVGIKRKRRKWRRKKLPKTHSSSHFSQSSGCTKDEVTIEYDQCADVLINTHTIVTYTLHAYPLNSVHSTEVAGCSGWDGSAPGMGEVNKLIKEKVITGDMAEDTILKNEQRGLSLYGDRTHMYIPRRCWFAWWKNRRRYVRRLGYAPWRTGLLLTTTDGQVCCEAWVVQTRSTDNTVKDLIWLLFSVPHDLEFQLGRANAVSGRIH